MARLGKAKELSGIALLGTARQSEGKEEHCAAWRSKGMVTQRIARLGKGMA
jgi:hypothetical protein